MLPPRKCRTRLEPLRTFGRSLTPRGLGWPTSAEIMILTHTLQRAAAALREADALLITAGAGLGVDSGLPDFRGNAGFWRAYPVAAKLGLTFAELANPAWFHKSPSLAWGFYGHRLNLYRQTQPHAGFGQLLEIAAAKPLGYFVFTSNVDGHFQKAGFDPSRVVECHGSIHHFQCTEPCADDIWEAGDEQVTVREDDFEAVPPLPACRRCGRLARPNVLMFGDATWLENRTSPQQAALDAWLEGLRFRVHRLVIIELGAGTAVPTVRLTSEDIARSLQARLIRINPREDRVPRGHFGVPLGAAEGIRRIRERLGTAI
jgi:NAD-dependent SIR2 family protein deacetylase